MRSPTRGRRRRDLDAAPEGFKNNEGLAYLSRYLAALQFDQESHTDSGGGSEFNLPQALRNSSLTNDATKFLDGHRHSRSGILTQIPLN